MNSYPGGRPDRPQRPWLGNGLITLAGADKTELDARSVDRSYFVGLGAALLLSALIAAVSISAATAIAFGVSMAAGQVILLGVTWYPLMLGFDRWLVAGDQASGFVKPDRNAAAVVAAWCGHFIAELFKISLRVVLAFLSSLLFANFLILAVFNHEIQQQLNEMQARQVNQWNQWVTADANSIKQQAQNVLASAKNQEDAVQHQFDLDQRALAKANSTYQSTLASLTKQGIVCSWQATYVTLTNPATGLQYQAFNGNYYSCPQAVIDAQTTYHNTQAKYTETQHQVDVAKAAIAKKLNVNGALDSIANAQAKAHTDMLKYYPKKADGLMARMQALQLLTTQPAVPCPNPPTVNDLASNPACTANYSAWGGTLFTRLRWWMLALELAPVGLKFINSVSPRRAYAWTMAAREADKREEARQKMEEARMRTQTNLAAYTRSEYTRLEEEGALLEYKQRELARQERHLGLRKIRARFAGVAAETERQARGRRGPHRRRTAPPLDNVVPLGARVDPRNTQADPGYRVNNSEDFLY